jgi:hypothetical protein
MMRQIEVENGKKKKVINQSNNLPNNNNYNNNNNNNNNNNKIKSVTYSSQRSQTYQVHYFKLLIQGSKEDNMISI